MVNPVKASPGAVETSRGRPHRLLKPTAAYDEDYGVAIDPKLLRRIDS